MLKMEDFKTLLAENREKAIRQLFTLCVDEWMNDGPEEVVRVLTLWATRGPDNPGVPVLSFGDQPDDYLAEYYATKTGEAFDTFDIRYRCPTCGDTWEEEYSSACDSECGNCGTNAIEALMYKDKSDKWTPEQEEEWASCDKCVCGKNRDEHNPVHNIPSGCKASVCHVYRVDMSRYQK